MLLMIAENLISPTVFVNILQKPDPKKMSQKAAIKRSDEKLYDQSVF